MTPPPKSRVDHFSDMLGGVLATELAETIAKAAKPNIVEMLKAAGMEGLLFRLQPDTDVFKALSAEPTMQRPRSPPDSISRALTSRTGR